MRLCLTSANRDNQVAIGNNLDTIVFQRLDLNITRLKTRVIQDIAQAVVDTIRALLRRLIQIAICLENEQHLPAETDGNLSTSGTRPEDKNP